MPPLLAVSNLHVALGGRRVLADVSLTLAAGATLALVGASGSGKTTLLRACLGLLPPGAAVGGELQWSPGDAPARDLMECDAAQWRALRGRQIAWIPQEPQAALDPRQSAGAHLRERLADTPNREAAAAALLRAVGLDPGRAADYPHQWSGGMQQRLLVALALAQRPRLLLADEPTSALDSLHQAQLIELLRRVRTEFQVAICLVTHDLAVAACLADTVCVLEAGTLVETGTAAQVFGAPRHSATAALVASQPPSPWREP